jgi:septal ring factor EnvC (AmiA/AmiB activator)
MKRILLILTLPLAFSALATKANALDQKNSSGKTKPYPGLEGLEGEFQYARDMARHVRIRSQIKKIDDEIFQVNRAISTRKYDRNQLRTEVARIDDELHSIDYELRDLSVHQPMSLTGGKASLVH